MVECGSFSANLCQFTEINGLLSLIDLIWALSYLV